jgi:hypothetical protein
MKRMGASGSGEHNRKLLCRQGFRIKGILAILQAKVSDLAILPMIWSGVHAASRKVLDQPFYGWVIVAFSSMR